MRYFLLGLLICCCYSFAGEMDSLKHGNYTRQEIAQDLRHEEGLKDSLFNVKRVEAANDIAYFCALEKDKNNHYVMADNKTYHLYDRIMLRTDQGWISATRLDSEADSPESAHCFYAPEVVLQSKALLAKVEQQGRKALCQPVHPGEPLRVQLLDALRANYIGDTNTITLNGVLPATKFVVDKLCASEKHAYFFGHSSGDPQSVYSESKDNLEVILQAGSHGTWHAVPKNKVLTQQSTVAWSRYNGVFSAAMLEALARQEEQSCALEGDTITATGTLQLEGTGDNAYWVVVMDAPLGCVRDANNALPDWNKKVQLLLSAEEQKAIGALSGKKVNVGGDILLALSTTHRTPLLLGNIFRLTERK